MISMANFLLRVQSPLHGTRRISTSPYQKVEDFLFEVKSAFDLPRNGWTVWMNREKSAELKSTKAKTLNSYKFKNGDMLYLDLQPQVTAMLEDNLEENGTKDKQPSLAAAGALLTGDSDDAARALYRDLSSSIVEDEVDQFLWKHDGTIPREKNEQLCRHGRNGMCFHCVPYEPYDEEYLAKVTPPIKFLSFHSYLRKLTGGVDKGKYAQLENLSCKIKPGCREHPPWPDGLCTKCQPNAITLQRQKFRHVDFIQFENHLIVERFLDYWRKTGNQRLGYLFGRYEYHKDVPLGIKAVVSAIYEPLQVSTKNSVELVEDEDEVVNSIAAKLGLRKVGWIFTDLVPLDSSTGTVEHFRGNVNSHFLSAEECIMAAHLQNRHPNPCRLSPEGHFGSKFVTVVITGDSQNQIHFEGYQVSNQCMDLVRDECLVPTKNASELGYAKESTNEQYVPDVFYKVTDRYGNEVTQLARPLPVEYLLLDMAVAFPKELASTFFASEAIRPFSIEHREGIGETQEFTGFAEYLTQFNGDRPMNMFCDLHLLTYLASCDMLPLKSKMNELLQALTTKDEALFRDWLQSEEWATVEQLLTTQAAPGTVNLPLQQIRLQRKRPSRKQKHRRKRKRGPKPKTVKDLPAEVLQKILVEVIGQTVHHELLDEEKWLEQSQRHLKSLCTVSKFWRAILTTDSFSIQLQEWLQSKSSRSLQLEAISITSLQTTTLAACCLNGKILVLNMDVDGTYTVQIYKLADSEMMKPLNVIKLCNTLSPVEIEACPLTGSIYLLCCKTRSDVSLVKLQKKGMGMYIPHVIIPDTPHLYCTLSVNVYDRIVMLSKKDPKVVFIYDNNGKIEKEIRVPPWLDVCEVVWHSVNRLLLIGYEGIDRVFVQIDESGSQIQMLKLSCTESMSYVIDAFGRLFVCGVNISRDGVEACFSVFDCCFERMELLVHENLPNRLKGNCVIKSIRESIELLMYSVENVNSHFLVIARLS